MSRQLVEYENIETAEQRDLSPFWDRVKRYSPFAFGTLREIPWPTWAILPMVGFFAVFYCGFESSFYRLADKNLYDLVPFLKTERSRNPHNPQVLIGGSCWIGMGIEQDLLEKRLNMPTSKVSMSITTPWETYAILKKYKHECRNVRLVFVTIDKGSIRHDMSISNYGKTRKTRFQILRSLGERKFPGTDIKINALEALLPLRTSLRDIVANAKHKYKTMEQSRDGKRLPLENDPCIISFRDVEEKYREKRKSRNHSFQNVDLIQKYRSYFDQEVARLTFEMAEYCQAKGIHVVFLVTPFRCGESLLPESDTPYRNEQDYLVFLSRLDSLNNCSVIAVRHLEDICPTCDYVKCYFDLGHMTHEGAMIYTNWLANRMLNDPKIAAALKSPRKPEEFFVKAYAKKARQKVMTWLQKPVSPNAMSPEVMIATPPANPIR